MQTWLFHNNCPEGQVFNESEVPKQLKQGWKTSPADVKTKAHKVKEHTYKAKDLINATSEDLVGMVKGLGFHVLTPEQLEAKIQQGIFKELKNYKQNTAERAELLEKQIEESYEKFLKNPDMNVGELRFLGKMKFGLSIKGNPRKDTLIKRINEAIYKATEHDYDSGRHNQGIPPENRRP